MQDTAAIKVEELRHLDVKRQDSIGAAPRDQT
jgi:hypothetical protein